MIAHAPNRMNTPKGQSFSDALASAVDSLGNTTESASTIQVQTGSENTHENRLVWRYRLQAESRRLLNQNTQGFKPHRISCCMRYLGFGIDRVAVQKHETKNHARYSGLMKCDSVWVCPVCSSVITERRKDELHQAVAKAKEKGLVLFFVTYTLRHQRDDDLKQTLSNLLDSYRATKAGRLGSEFRKDFAIRGSIKALEVTHGLSGWHPHLHEILFVDGSTVTEKTRRRLEFQLQNRWQSEIKRRGGDALREIGVKVQNGDSFVAEYVAKFGREPREDGWSLQSEIAKTPSKTARGKDGRTPFALLEDSAAGDSAAGKLFVSYAAAFKGRAQLIWSPGLSGLLGVEFKSEKDANEESEASKYFTLAFIEREDWGLILKYEKRAELLNVAATGDLLELKNFLLSLHFQEVEF